MWSVKSEVGDIYLSGGTLAIRAGVGIALHPIVPIAPIAPIASLADDWASSLQAGLAEWPKRRWRIWLGGRRSGLHLCDPIPGVRNIEEAEAALGASLSLDGSVMSARLATWSARGPWLALSTEAGLVERLMSTVEEGEGQVHSVRPWWTMLSGVDSPGVAMCDDESITYWRVEQGVFASAGTLGVAEDQQPASLQRLRVGGALKAWRLVLEAHAGSAHGMAAWPLNEGADAAA